MAVNIPIISEFDGTGIRKAKEQFSQLEGAGKKAQFAIKKAAVPAGLAIAAVATALFDATTAAIDDKAAQDQLAQMLKNTTGATDDQVAAVEDWITQQGKLLGFSDDKLRPALEKLTTQTHDVTEAQELLGIAMDISAGTGKDLNTVTEALAKFAGGSETALKKLSPEIGNMMKAGMSADDAIKALAGTFEGAAATAADTAKGKFERLGISLNETKESIGAALLPAVEAVLPLLTAFGDWAAAHPDILLAIAGAIGGIAAAIVLINAAIAVSPIGWMIIGVGLLAAALVLAYKKFEPFRDIVDAVFGGIRWWINNVTIPAFKTMLTVAKTIFNGIATIWNNTFGKLSFSIPSWIPGIGGKGFDVPDIPLMAAGGIVTSPTLAMIGEGSGPEAVIPLNRMGEFGMGGGMNITVNAGLMSTPDQIGQLIIEAIQKAQRRSGQVFAAA